MEDRELLELAAKAAGIDAKPLKGFDGVERLHIGAGSYMPMIWNPLTDDGDALRLAIKLGMNVNFGNQEEGAVIAFDFSGRFQDCEESGEPNVATRRAIVRAAAEIGKGMP